MVTVLVLDDDEKIRNLIVKTVQLAARGKSCRVLTAENGIVGSEILIFEPKVDLVISDLCMGPGPNGIDLLSDMDLRFHKKSTPFVLFSGSIADEDVETVLVYGATIIRKANPGAFHQIRTIVGRLFCDETNSTRADSGLRAST